MCNVNGMTLQSDQVLNDLKEFSNEVVKIAQDSQFYVNRRKLANKLLLDLSGDKRDSIKKVTELYTGKKIEEVCKDKWVFPTEEPNITVFPRTCLISAGEDVLLEQQTEFKTRLQQAKIDCLQIIEAGEVHGFMGFGKYFDENASRILRECRGWIFKKAKSAD